jgi:imidazolonepropionase-like amidohydrolase
MLMLALAASWSGAQTPLKDLAVPPPDAERFSIISTAGKHGDSARWTTAGGNHLGRESMDLRGQVFELDSTSHIGKDGLFDRVSIRGFTPTGDAAETFAVDGRHASWKSPVDKGSAVYATPAMYIAFGGPMDVTADAIEQLVAAPGKALPLLPAGKLHAELLTTAVVGSGAKKKTVTAYALIGLDITPMPVWVDDSGKFFAMISPLSWLPVGYEGSLLALQKAQDDALAKRSPAIAKSLLETPAGPVAFTNVRAFVAGARFADAQTVIVDKGLITAVGPSASVPLPPRARVIDGKGKTLVPGLWDSHMHVGGDASGPMLLSLGVTSVRDPGNDNGLTLARIARRNAGELLSPHVYPSVLIDGKGPNTAQVATVVNSQEEALVAVRKAKADGFCAIKIYGSFNPAWVRATASEAHRLGLHVHGHLPAGMRPMQAMADGYDEITHIYFVAMQAMPDEVVSKSNGISRMLGPARYAKDVDLDSDPMKSLIATMASRHITADPTLVVAESLLVPDNGDLSPAIAPYAGTLPPTVERSYRQGGLAVPHDLTRADFRASFRKLQQLVGQLHKAGVPIVAGTDGTGFELVRELELYVGAGFTTAEALNSATLAPAHLLGVDAKTGSIAVGKVADLDLVEGDPSINIGDLRHTRMVMMDGKLMDADALRAAGGFAGRPKYLD